MRDMGERIVGSFGIKKEGIEKAAKKYLGLGFDTEEALEYVTYLFKAVLKTIPIFIFLFIFLDVIYGLTNRGVLLSDDNPSAFKTIGLALYYITLATFIFYDAFKKTIGTKKGRVKETLDYIVMPVYKLNSLLRLLSKKGRKELEDTIVMVKTVAVFDMYLELEGSDSYKKGVSNKAQLEKQFEEVKDFLNKIVDVEIDDKVYITRGYNLLKVEGKYVVISQGFKYNEETELYKTLVVDVPELDINGIKMYLNTLEDEYELDKEYEYLTEEYKKIKENDKKYKEELVKAKDYLSEYDDMVKKIEDKLFIYQSKKREENKLKIEEELRELKNKVGEYND